MFAARYYPGRMFARRYFPAVGAEAVVPDVTLVPPRHRIFGIDTRHRPIIGN
jgi:hypothetical protein